MRATVVHGPAPSEWIEGARTTRGILAQDDCDEMLVMSVYTGSLPIFSL